MIIVKKARARYALYMDCVVATICSALILSITTITYYDLFLASKLVLVAYGALSFLMLAASMSEERLIEHDLTYRIHILRKNKTPGAIYDTRADLYRRILQGDEAICALTLDDIEMYIFKYGVSIIIIDQDYYDRE